MSTELIFHGTGNSSCLPNIACLVAPPGAARCMTCYLAANSGSAPNPHEAIKNRRRNTGAILRVRDGRKEIVVVIDAGKSFVGAALEWFPKYGLNRIDGLILTHAHADAMNGLDDLRCWTLQGAIQDSIDIYLSQRTFEEVQRTFPYLVDKGMATGGGAVPEFQWHIIQEYNDFDICGIIMTPILVHHGRYFGPVSGMISPPLSPPLSAVNTPNISRSSSYQSFGSLPFPTLTQAHFTAPMKAPVTPYLSFGFLLPNFLYISDASEIPSYTLDYLACLSESRKPQVAVVDCLRPTQHPSHFGIEQAVAAARALGCKRTYLTGFMCGLQEWISHEGWVRVCKAVSEGETTLKGWKGDPGEKQRCQEMLNWIVPQPGSWIRPSFDGLRIVVKNGKVFDGAYD
ncbi:hypothetical protein CALVIDRAFT_485865 [Calocera viscosa TUFC12733]|uniref:Metallo-beta-lactamase domain-containing protein n=1 Tax=Calocera viscosa (strain TUFC12733) TaxID=1330018 RepID=A0A167JC62_CALVF|nr:hypothetical protein CALVIDRAFT_485865 [Calocera viscosa TUFC12733]